MSIARDVSGCAIASRSAPSTITNWPFETSQPLTSSSFGTSRSCVGHHRFCLIGVLHSRWSVRKETSDERAFGVVAGASPTGIVTRPKLRDPFQIVRMGPPKKCSGTGRFAASRRFPSTIGPVTEAGGGRPIGRLWRDAVGAGRSSPAYLVEGPDGWREVSWEEAGRAVDEIANGLLALGVHKGDAFGILAQTSLEWSLFDYALSLTGAVGAAIYANSSPKDCKYVIEHSDAVGVLVEDEEQRAKIAGLGLPHAISFAELDDLRARGREFAAANPTALAEAEAAIDEDDLFTFIYTSGTTGPPKACMIRHRNYYAMAACTEGVEGFAVFDDTMLLYLPLAHNFGRLMHLLGGFIGFTIAFCPDPLRIAEALPAVRPTILPSVPRLYEKVHTALVSQFEQTQGVRRRLLDWALRTGRQASTYRQRGESLPPGLALRHAVADRLVYRKVKNRLGGRLRLGVSGGAPLAKESGEVFHALDITIIEGWGLTEV